MPSDTKTSPSLNEKNELEELEIQQRLSRISRKILVMSGKGGVGKSTVAANLAFELARQGNKVGLLDVDLHGPSIPTLLGIADRKLAQNNQGGVEPIEVEGLKVVSMGMLLENISDPVVWRGPLKYNVIRQFIKDVSWGNLDFLIIDSPPGTGDEPLSVAQLMSPGCEAILVTTPQELAIADVRRSVSFCRMLEMKLLGIIENMSGMICPHCQKKIDLFQKDGGRNLAQEMDAPFLGSVPLDPEIVKSCDQGTPFVLSLAKSPGGQAFKSITKAVLSPTDSKPEPTQPEVKTMKIAVPTVDKKLCLHFGHCQQFALVEADPEKKTIIKTEYLTPPGHEPGVLPRWLHEQEADVIIAAGMGNRAQSIFSSQGIQVVVGAPIETPEKITEDFLAGTLVSGDNICDH